MFLKTDPTKQISFTFMNVQRFEPHLCDIISDEVLMSSDIMAVTETWMSSIYRNFLKKFCCVTNF